MRSTYIVIFSLILALIVGVIVFSAGNNPSGAKVTVLNTTNSSNTSNSQINTSNSASSGKITSTELSNHDSQSDCWVSYKGKVYDITSFLPKHPGSASAISPYCGTSSEFEEAFSDQHGTSQVNTLIRESVYKGEL